MKPKKIIGYQINYQNDTEKKKKNQIYLKGFGVGWESEAEGGASHEPAQWL